MIHQEKTCEVTCTDNDKTVTAEVAHFRPQQSVTVVLATSKILLEYNSTVDLYVGSKMGMEFTSKGPKYYETKQGRL
jgi:hypothetical protein